MGRRKIIAILQQVSMIITLQTFQRTIHTFIDFCLSKQMEILPTGKLTVF